MASKPVYVDVVCPNKTRSGKLLPRIPKVGEIINLNNSVFTVSTVEVNTKSNVPEKEPDLFYVDAVIYLQQANHKIRTCEKTISEDIKLLLAIFFFSTLAILGVTIGLSVQSYQRAEVCKAAIAAKIENLHNYCEHEVD